MRFVSHVDSHLLNKVKCDLNLIPKHLLKFCFDRGLQILVSDSKKAKPIIGRYRCGDGRFLHQTSHFDCTPNRMYLNADDGLLREDINIVLHEFGHALDYALNLDTKRHWWFSSSTPSIFRRGKPLDWYAATNSAERFATVFEASFRPELVPCKAYCTHTVNDVAKYEPETYAFLKELKRGIN